MVQPPDGTAAAVIGVITEVFEALCDGKRFSDGVAGYLFLLVNFVATELALT